MIGAAAVVLAVAFGNVMSNPVMPQSAVRHDVRALMGFRADVTCGNEIEPERYKRAWRAESARHGLRARAVAYPDPVAVRGRPVAVYARRLSGGVPGLTPDRWAVVVRGPSWAVICTHLVSRAWTSDDGTTAQRRDIYREEIARLRRIVGRNLAAGRNVIIGGDLNNPDRVRWRRREVFLANLGRMQATAIPAPGWRAIRAGRRTIPARRLATDHPMIRRGVTFAPIGH